MHHREADYVANIGKVFRFRLNGMWNASANGDYEFRILPGTPFRLELQHPDDRVTAWPSEEGFTPGVLIAKSRVALCNTALFFGLGEDEQAWQGANNPLGAATRMGESFDPLQARRSTFYAARLVRAWGSEKV